MKKLYRPLLLLASALIFVEPAPAKVLSGNTEVPFYRCWSAHPHVNVGRCEFTVHETMASAVFSTAVLLGEGWTPGDDLKKRGFRKEELLFGYWPMP